MSARERLLETAGHLFYTQGYMRTGINQIIAEADVAKASFYAHFSSKKKLAKAYLELRHSKWFESLENELKKADQPAEKLTRLFTFLIHWMEEASCRGCAFINLNAEFPDDRDDISAIVRSHKEQLMELIHDLTEQAMDGKKGDNNHDIAVDNLAKLLYLLFEGAIVECQNFKSKWPAEKALELAKAEVRTHLD